MDWKQLESDIFALIPARHSSAEFIIKAVHDWDARIDVTLAKFRIPKVKKTSSDVLKQNMWFVRKSLKSQSEVHPMGQICFRNDGQDTISIHSLSDKNGTHKIGMFKLEI